MKNVVIDTNVILVAFGRNSLQRWIIDKLAIGRYTLIVSTEIVFEYAEVLNRHQSPLLAISALGFLANSPFVQKHEVYYRLNLIQTDPDDNKFVDCAFAGNADAIVTEDAHFDILKTIPFPKIAVLSVEEFAAYLAANPA